MGGDQGSDKPDISFAGEVRGPQDDRTMFSRLLGYLKNKRQLHSWQGTDLGKAIDEHARYHFAKGNLKHFEKQNKQLLSTDLHTRISAVLESPEPVLKCREELATSVVAFAGLQVLCLTPQEKEQNSLYKNMKLVSGDLHKYILSCAPYSYEIVECINENGDITEDELTRIAKNRSAVYSYYANGFNIVRGKIEPVKERDWFWPFVLSSMVVSEDNFRKQTGLPVLATAIDTSVHSHFVNIVLSGEQDPLLSWERRYGKLHDTAV